MGKGKHHLHPSSCLTTVLLNRRLALLFLVISLLLSFSIASSSSSQPSTTASVRRSGMPGFLYTRIRGRCTPQYWSSRREEWPRMVPQSSTVSKVFGSRAYERYRSDLTVLEATSRNDDLENAFAALLKQATTALLNSYSRQGYPYSAWEVKTLVIQAMVSKDAASVQAKQFLIANEACN